MSLIDWQLRLVRHFEQLRQQRSGSVGDRPIFALEHDLSSTERSQLDHQIRSHIAASPPQKEHSLPWVVYAAEIGYRYAGDEYWQTFEAETPGWVAHGDRLWIRRQFVDFQARFGGAKPSGKWAEWFSIICWPIVHAILPKDLQQQLAKVLYDIRYSFATELFNSPVKLGELIALRSWNASSRFRNLAQEPLLLGQIATALLLHDQQSSNSLILPSTLQRITTDLEHERQARAWLLDARTQATRATFRGLKSGTMRPSEGHSASREPAREQLAALGIEPRMILRPVEDESWEVFLEIPDLSPLLLKFPAFRDIFTGSRCVVAGASGRPLWQGRILRGPQRVRLSKWPNTDEPLLKFERSNSELDYILRTESLLRPGSSRLIRVASDGLGYELHSLNVRAGNKYILLSTAPIIENIDGTRSIKVQCEGVHALQLELPEALSDAWLSRLKQLGLNQSRSIDVWPVGIPPAAWDGEGQAEWLRSDTPCLAIRSDHPIGELAVTLDHDEWSRIQFPTIPAGRSTFIELPDLPIGPHHVSFRARMTDGRFNDNVGHLKLLIREPHEWVPGVTAQGAFIALLDPSAPSLEQLWEGRHSAEIHGPAGRQVACTVTFKERQTTKTLFQKRLPNLTLPVDTKAWHEYFERYVHDNREFATAYDLTHSCLVELSADELGHFSIECERDFVPLRWALKRSQEAYELRIIDDSGSEAPLTIARYEVHAPNIAIALPNTELTFRVPHDGGLYTAKTKNLAAAILVPPFKIKRLQDLGVHAKVTETGHSNVDLVSLLSVAETWATARLSGEGLLASIHRRNDVVDALLRVILCEIAGDHWCRAESRFRKHAGHDALRALSQAITNKKNEIALCVVLERDYHEIAKLAPRDRATQLSKVAEKFLGLTNAKWLSELSLRLASGVACDWAGEEIHSGIEQFRNHPTLLRAARFLVLSMATCFQQRAVEVGPVYLGWKWE